MEVKDNQIESLMGTGPPPSSGQMEKMRWAKKNPPKDPEASFAGKTVLITGSNTGIGLQAALKFAVLGASKLILAVRTQAKGDEAKKKIIALAKQAKTDIIVMQLDMGSFDSVRSFAAQIEKEVATLDVAVLNAGIAPPKYSTAKTGWESALQVNIHSTALLAILLMPKLKQTTSKTGRLSQLTITGSFACQYVKAEEMKLDPGESLLKKMSAPENFNSAKSYGQIKLLTQYIMHGLVEDYAKSDGGEIDVAVNVACPGLCTTDLGRDFPWYVALPTKLMQMYCARSAEEGSRSLVSATLLGKAGHGKFWTNDVFTE
jgi:NAD(P)-dependent dehydrogenase (short-subunit alcohol dehydrogenase family)